MGMVAKITEKMMPSTGTRILRPGPWAAQAAIFTLLLATSAWAAAKFTLVLGGKISSEDALDDKAGKLVSANAIGDLARAAGGMGVSFDADAGVVSVNHDGGAVAEKISGFKGAAVTFVIDGKITRVTAKMGADGVPFLAP